MSAHRELAPATLHKSCEVSRAYRVISNRAPLSLLQKMSGSSRMLMKAPVGTTRPHRKNRERVAAIVRKLRFVQRFAAGDAEKYRSGANYISGTMCLWDAISEVWLAGLPRFETCSSSSLSCSGSIRLWGSGGWYVMASIRISRRLRPCWRHSAALAIAEVITTRKRGG